MVVNIDLIICLFTNHTDVMVPEDLEWIEVQ